MEGRQTAPQVHMERMGSIVRSRKRYCFVRVLNFPSKIRKPNRHWRSHWVMCPLANTNTSSSAPVHHISFETATSAHPFVDLHSYPTVRESGCSIIGSLAQPVQRERKERFMGCLYINPTVQDATREESPPHRKEFRSGTVDLIIDALTNRDGRWLPRGGFTQLRSLSHVTTRGVSHSFE